MTNMFASLKFLANFVQQAMKDSAVSAEDRITIEKNEHYESKIGWDSEKIMLAFGSERQVKTNSVEFIEKTREYQSANGLAPDGVLGPATYEHMMESILTPTERSIKKIFEMVVLHESGGNYSAMNRDGEFKGLFDKTWIRRTNKPHPASGKIHVGLSFGSIQFTQDGGSLGKLLALSYKSFPDKFKKIMGGGYDDLLEITTRPGPSGLSTRIPRGPRVHPVRLDSGKDSKREDLWEGEWVRRFQKFGEDPDFQMIQRQLALDEYLKPVLPFLKEQGLRSEKMIACAFDGCVHRGVGGFRTLIRGLKAKDEKEVLTLLGRKDKRFKRLVESNLSNDEWVGWSNYE